MNQPSKIILLFLCCITFAHAKILAQSKKYYVAPSGNDANNGLSPKTAWRSLDKINSTDFRPGDSIFFQAGNIFNGTIKLTSADNGTKSRPVVLTSYGPGKATINAGDSDGLLAVNTSYLKLVGLNFVGSAVKTNKGSGIHFFANDSLHAPTGIEIHDCNVRGFTTYGIAFGANSNASYKGYENVRILHCSATENGQAGIASYGSYKGFQHKNFYIAYTKAYGNRGILSRTENHSGNGIVMGMVDGLMIEHCEAYDNGADNRCDAGGPVGIWVWMCKNAIIQYCISHDNHTGTSKDGGGFDIDGGASNCIIRYNYSYNNEGAGYLLAEYGALFPFTNNTICFNISANDGRKNNYGAISVWGADSAFSVTNSWVYNNTIYLDDKNLVNGTPAAVTFMGPHFRNVVIANNIFATSGTVNFINSDSLLKPSMARLLHNNYYSLSKEYSFKYGPVTFSSMQEWQNKNPGQEKINNQSIYLDIDPIFTGYFSDTTDMKIFVLQKNSLLRKQQFLIKDHISDTRITKDIGGNTLPANKKIFPGAFIK